MQALEEVVVSPAGCTGEANLEDSASNSNNYLNPDTHDPSSSEPAEPDKKSSKKSTHLSSKDSKRYIGEKAKSVSEMLGRLLRLGPVNDQWQKDLERLNRQVQHMNMKVSRGGDANARANNYRELRVILSDVALLDRELQEQIAGDVYHRPELERRIEELRVLNQAVKNVDAILVGDRPATLPVEDTSSTYASGSIEGTDIDTFQPRQELMKQTLLSEEQDAQLDQLCRSLQSIRQIGEDIHIEVSYHNELLQEVSEEAAATQSTMDKVRKRLKLVTKSRSSKCIFCYIIVICIAIVCVLVFMQ